MVEDKINPEQILAEIEDILRTMPARETLGHDTPEHLAWFGRTAAVIELWDYQKVSRFDLLRMQFFLGMSTPLGRQALREMFVMIHQAQNDLRMRTSGPMNIAVGQGRVFEYFDELRKTIELAERDVLFIDPYLDAEFVSRYLPHVHAGVSIRLLTSERKLNTLLPAVDLFIQQNGLVANVRSVAAGLHDRYVFIDNASCYQSGASFKDGAKLSPTTLTQITDAFDAIWKTYEAMWAGAKVQR